MFFATTFLSFILFSSLVCASQLEARKALGAAFAANPSIDVSAIYNAAKSSNKKSVASYLLDIGSSKKTDVYADWQDLKGVSAYHFFADMDVDCDGTDYRCAGNTDGQAETSFGRLDASQTPFYVLPLSLSEKYKNTIKPNALGAIICNGNMFYGIFGDQNGNTPEVIGEASLLLASACFPNDKITGNNGHDAADVLYIVFGDQVPSNVGQETISTSTLKALGDKQVLLLQSALLGSSGDEDASSSKPPSNDDNKPSNSPSNSSSKDDNKPPTSSPKDDNKPPASSSKDDNKPPTSSSKPSSSISTNNSKGGSTSGKNGTAGTVPSKSPSGQRQCSKRSKQSKRSSHRSRNQRRLSH